jgi:hypothetical protein
MYDFTAPLWAWDGEAPWHFVTVPDEISDEIEARAAHPRSAFGSVRVEVTVGASSWATSLFPDEGSQAYVLPVKKQVRVREGLLSGDDVTVRLELLED